jgi:hypothetical protein
MQGAHVTLGMDQAALWQGVCQLLRPWQDVVLHNHLRLSTPVSIAVGLIHRGTRCCRDKQRQQRCEQRVSARQHLQAASGDIETWRKQAMLMT